MSTLLSVLPKLNAALNATSGVLLVAGWRAIKSGERERHRKLMLGACCASALFLAGYLTRVALQGTHRFAGTGFVRLAYFVLLLSHMALAVAVVPLVLRALSQAFAARFDSHKKTTRILWPIWLYVSATGVVVYVMLYHAPGYIR